MARQQDQVEITSGDILEIIHNNIYIDGRYIGDLDLRSFDFEKYMKDKWNTPFDKRKFFQEWHHKISKDPWKYKISFRDMPKPGDVIFVAIYPAEEFRNQMERYLDPKYKSGYELPCILIWEKLDDELFHKLKDILDTIIYLQNLSFLGEVKYQFAFLYLLYVHIYWIEETASRLSTTSILSRGSLENPPISRDKIEKIKSLSLDDKISLMMDAGYNAFLIEHILNTWEGIGNRFALEMAGSEESDEKLIHSMLPPQYRKVNEIKEVLDRSGTITDTYCVPIEFEIAEIAKELDQINDLGKKDLSEIFIESTNLGIIGNKVVDPDLRLFRKVGSHWFIAFEGKIYIYDHLDGFDYIRILLDNPGKELHVSILNEICVGHDFAEIPRILGELDSEELGKMGLSLTQLDSPISLVDKKTQNRVKAERELIKEKLTGDNFINPEEKIALEDKLERLESYIKATSGYKGSDAKFQNGVNKMRISIRNRITKALEAVKENNSSLYDHFLRSIKTGQFCSYSPEKPINWST